MAELLPLVAYEGAAIWLFRRLRALRIFETLPTGFREQLKAQAFAAAMRSLRVEEEALATLRLLAAAGVPVVLIKGIARRALAPQFPYLDARITNDVDLLLPVDRIQEGYALLVGQGYEQTDPDDAKRRDHHHLPGLWNQRRIAVELHATTSSRISPDTAWSRATEGGRELEWGNLRVRVPAPTEIAWAAATHAINDMIVQGHRLQHFLEVAALAHSRPGLDWNLLLRRTGESETFDEESGIPYPAAIARQWLQGSLQLVSPALRPAELPPPALDLESLLGWRLAILGTRKTLGRPLSERLLEEGVRQLIGVDPQRAPPGTPPVYRLRRRLAGRMSRMAYRAWRVIWSGQ
ncbi:MAG TPA: nucleotidyltransferase family protein [Gemmatimonadales bacterium]